MGAARVDRGEFASPPVLQLPCAEHRCRRHTRPICGSNRTAPRVLYCLRRSQVTALGSSLTPWIMSFSSFRLRPPLLSLSYCLC